MTLTLLFDLDDTLLNNDIDTFLPAYLKMLGKHLAGYVAPERMVPELLAATRLMQVNNSAALSLEEAFDQAFYPGIGQSKEALRVVLEQFYETIFPDLQVLSSQRPEAQAVIDYANQRGHTMVVATNPLFPRRAIEHRLKWAGFDPDPFAILTTFERFHFAKPNPAYFAEILAQLGWPNQPAVVIGNSLSDDLAPAAQLGLPVYWVTAGETDLPGGFHPLSAAGELAGVPAWLETIETAKPQPDLHAPGALLAVLKATPAALDTFCRDLSDQKWCERPAPDEWSVTEVLAHVRDVDREVNLPRLEKILDGSNPFVAGVNSDSWIEERNYNSEDGPTALRGFIEARGELVERLEALPEAGWQLPARHAIFGPTHLRELMGFLVTHDQSHIQQVLNTIRAASG